MNSPLGDDEVERLEALLAGPAFASQALSLAEIQGFLTALECGPAPAPREEWQPAVLGNPAFATPAEEKEFLGLLTRFHAEIVAALKAGEPLGLVLNEVKKGRHDYAGWCQAFLDGVEFSTVPWDSVGDANALNELLFPIALLAGEVDPASLKLKPAELAELVAECEDDLAELPAGIAAVFRAPPKKPAPRPPAQTGKKPPR